MTNIFGSVATVVLPQTGNNQWQGPRGEIYNGMPTEAQLRGTYGM